MEKMPLQRDWSNLPADATRDIASYLSDGNYVRFRSVCTSWRSATTKRPVAPWLIFRKSLSLQLCNLSNTDETFPAQLPEDVLVCGSSLGWIFVLDDTLSFYICNPFSGRKIPLPPLPEMPYRVIRSGRTVFLKELDIKDSPPIPKKLFISFKLGDNPKFEDIPYQKYAIMSSDPATSPDDCIVVTQSNRTKTMIRCRPGDTSWTALSAPSGNLWNYVFYKGQLYALLDYEFRLFVCPIEPGARGTEILPADPLFSDGQARVAARSSFYFKHLEVFYEDLLLVSIYHYRDEETDFQEDIFEVFRVDLDGGQLRFVKLDNLGGRALFLGYGGSMPVHAGYSTRGKGNCVYQYYGGYIRVFNMEDGSIEHIANPSGAEWINFIARS